MRMAWIGMIGGLAFLLACSGGNGGEDSQASAQATGGGSDGGGECELPAEYDQLPLVPGCFHVSDHRIAAQASTTLSQEEAIAFFEKALPESGWTIEGRETMDENIVHLDLSGHGVRSAWVEVGARDSTSDRTIGVTYYVN